ncbi:MAG: hypothetical protein GDA56_12975 [Hormoscilla sp. GM7CHS1pb]|nr:hypothetical protein [Hormoscilla sp. GM7CHS1pb]
MISRFTLEIPVHWQVCYNLLNLVSTIFKRVKKKVKALFEEMTVHNRGYWERRLKEIKNFAMQIKRESLSEAQLRKILEDSSEDVDAVIEALEEASEIMEEYTPTLFR